MGVVMRLIIAGSRGVDNVRLVRFAFRQFRHYKVVIEIVCGGAKGIDQLGADLAEERGIALNLKLAEWDVHGKSAGYIRNTEMADCADGLLAIWDLKSRGTKHMITIALAKGLYVEVYDSRGKHMDINDLVKYGVTLPTA